jgi:hypothetical protein
MSIQVEKIKEINVIETKKHKEINYIGNTNKFKNIIIKNIIFIDTDTEYHCIKIMTNNKNYNIVIKFSKKIPKSYNGNPDFIILNDYCEILRKNTNPNYYINDYLHNSNIMYFEDLLNTDEFMKSTFIGFKIYDKLIIHGKSQSYSDKYIYFNTTTKCVNIEIITDKGILYIQLYNLYDHCDEFTIFNDNDIEDYDYRCTFLVNIGNTNIITDKI